MLDEIAHQACFEVAVIQGNGARGLVACMVEAAADSGAVFVGVVQDFGFWGRGARAGGDGVTFFASGGDSAVGKADTY